MNNLVYVGGGIGALVLLLTVEVLCVKFASPVSPSSATRLVARGAVYVFTALGRLFARLSGLIDYIDLEALWRFIRHTAWDFTKAFLDITVPIAQTIVSPWYAARAYYEYLEVFNHPLLVSVVSGLLVAAVTLVLIYYGVADMVRQHLPHVHSSYYIVALVTVVCSSLYFNFFDKLGGYALVRRVFGQ